MNIKNWKLKRKQQKSLEINNDYANFIRLQYQCPKCIWGTDDLNVYVSHLENHLTKKEVDKYAQTN